MKHPTLVQMTVVGAAGFLGAISRYLVGHYAGWLAGSPKFPVGTLIINISASFLLGLFMTWSQKRADEVHELFTLAVATGFIGTYSTYSTFMWETARLNRDGAFVLAGAYLVASLALGLAAVWAGIKLGG